VEVPGLLVIGLTSKFKQAGNPNIAGLFPKKKSLHYKVLRLSSSRERCIIQKMNFKAAIEPESSQTSNSRPLQNALILRSLLGGVSERTLVRDERQQRKNSKESHYAAASSQILAIIYKSMILKTRTHWNILLIAFFMSLSCFQGCTPDASVAEKARRDNILLVGNGGDVTRLDPQASCHAYERRIQMALFEPLVTPGPNQTIQPALAESWQISPDCKTYTFYLRKNARWSDGTPLTAHDCVFSFQRMLSPPMANALTWLIHCIKGSKAFSSGESKDLNSIGIKALDNYTLEITLEKPFCNFLNILTFFAFVPLSEKHIRNFGDWDSKLNPWDRPENLVGNGPFRIKEHQIGQSLTVERNPFYWDAQNVALNGITFNFIGDSRTEEQSFRSDQLHVTYAIPPNRIAFYETHSDPEEQSCLQLNKDSLAPELLVLNTQDPALQNIKVRQALSLAIDRNHLASLFSDHRSIAKGFLPPGIGPYTSPEGLVEFNPEKARQLFTEAGYPGGKGFPTLTFNYSATLPYKPIAEALQSMFKENLGIQLDVVQLDAKTNFAKLFKGDFQINRLVWRVECADVWTLLAFFASDNPSNVTHWKSAAFDAYLAEALTMKDPKDATTCFQKAETLLIQGMPIIPLLCQPLAYLKKNYISNWTIYGSTYIPYKSIFMIHP
jgi:oligopeptide transport system substrate-binding protein